MTQNPDHKNQPQSAGLPLLFKTLGGGSFIQCACTNPQHTVLILSKSSRLYLSGSFSFQVIYGFLEVNGYLFAPKKYSPTNYSRFVQPSSNLPTLFALRDELSTEVHIERIQSRLREFVNDTRKMISFVEENSPVAILLIKTEKDIATRFIQQQYCSNIFAPFGRSLANHEFVYLANKSGDDSFMEQKHVDALKTLEDSQREIVKKIYRTIENEAKCIVFLAGNKGAGKSTLFRFLANSLNSGVSENPPKQKCRVFLFDADVGQSELSPSGCVSLHEVTKPMLGVPFASQLATLTNSYFFGSNSPGVDFDFYQKLVEKLLDKFHAITSQDDNYLDRFVLIVNSCGWIEDLGYDLTLRMLHTTKPNILVNIEVNEALNFIVPLNYQQITTTIRRLASTSYLNNQNLPKIAPSQQRHLQTMGYMAQLFHQSDRPLGNSLRLAELSAYRVRFGSIAVYIHPELPSVVDSLLLSVMNCAFVALCKVEEGFEKYFERKHIMNDPSLSSRLELQTDLHNMSLESGELSDGEDVVPVEHRVFPFLRCFGFGLIRAIHPQRKLFYVLTPVDQHVLASQVNVFAYGHCLNTPDWLIFDPSCREPAPYVVELDSGLQEHHKKFFSPLRPIRATGNKGMGMAPATRRKSGGDK